MSERAETQVWERDGQRVEVAVDKRGYVLVSIEVFAELLDAHGWKRVDHE